MRATSELSMASWRSLGICTWRTSATKDITSDVMKIRLCDSTMGSARRSQVLLRSGSIVAAGAR